MTYSTVEAYVKDKEIIFWDNFIAPKKTMKVLVTFIETQNIDEMDYWLYEVDKNEVTDEMIKEIEEWEGRRRDEETSINCSFSRSVY